VRDERGLVLPTRLLAVCISAVAMAALVIIADNPDKAPDDAATPAVTTPSKDADTNTTPSPSATPKAKPIKRGDIFVEVFNNTRVKGLASGVAEKAKAGGWNVVGSDNWYGTVDGTTVYYPPRLREAGKALGRDLGIKKVKPAEEPMNFDRLTVILTDDWHG
jgi:hypothetical protein